jgi:hypothetical protein
LARKMQLRALTFGQYTNVNGSSPAEPFRRDVDSR